MDTIGLLAAWVGTLSFLVALAVIVATSRLNSPLEWQRASKKWGPATPGCQTDDPSETGQSMAVSNGAVLNLVFLFGTMIRDLIFGATVVLVAIQILDLGPALLAVALPFSINAKLITRVTGISLFFMAFLFVFRLCYLAVNIRRAIGEESAVHSAKGPAGVSGASGSSAWSTQD